MEFGIALWDFNRAEKATQVAVRVAAVGTPPAPDFLTYDGRISGTNDFGDFNPPCTTGGDGFVGCNPIECTASDAAGAVVSCTNYSGTVDAAAFQRVLTAARNFFPTADGLNLEVEYAPITDGAGNSLLGFVGRPGGAVVPAVTVRLTGLNYNFILLNIFLGSNTIPMPEFNATLTGEELNTAAIP
jgi:hypothetical protein